MVYCSSFRFFPFFRCFDVFNICEQLALVNCRYRCRAPASCGSSVARRRRSSGKRAASSQALRLTSRCSPPSAVCRRCELSHAWKRFFLFLHSFIHSFIHSLSHSLTFSISNYYYCIFIVAKCGVVAVVERISQATLATAVVSETSRVYVTLPANVSPGLHFVRVTSNDAAALFADSSAFFVESSGNAGLYAGEAGNLLDRDYAATSARLMPSFAMSLTILAMLFRYCACHAGALSSFVSVVDVCLNFRWMDALLF